MSIAYSLGNFSGYHTLNTSGDLGTSAVLRVTLDARGRFVKGRIVPLRLDAAARRGSIQPTARGKCCGSSARATSDPVPRG
jgi:hypothetical protein